MKKIRKKKIKKRTKEIKKKSSKFGIGKNLKS